MEVDQPPDSLSALQASISISGPSFSTYRSSKSTKKKVTGKKVAGKFAKKRSNSAPPLQPHSGRSSKLGLSSPQQKALLESLTLTELARQLGTGVHLTTSNGTQKMNTKTDTSGNSVTKKPKTWWSATSFKHYKKSDSAKFSNSNSQSFKNLSTGGE